MSSANARNIVELRQLLANKFPGVKMSADPRTGVVVEVAGDTLLLL